MRYRGNLTPSNGYIGFPYYPLVRARNMEPRATSVPKAKLGHTEVHAPSVPKAKLGHTEPRALSVPKAKLGQFISVPMKLWVGVR